MTLAFFELFRSGGLDCRGPPLGIQDLFHHLPPVVREPVEFPSCSSGSAKAQALWEEVNKMLQKGALELSHQPGPGFYDRLFLVQKVMSRGNL